MSPGIDPQVDFAFKLMLGSPNHTRITIHFLNAVLQMPSPVVWVEILNPIQNKDRSEEKLIVLDVLARDSDGQRFNIEMQTTLPFDLAQRLTYYNCMNYVPQIGQGDRYFQLRPAISICVLNRTLYSQIADYHLSFRLRCDQHNLVFNNDLRFHTLELPKFVASSECPLSELPPLEKWLYFLKHASKSNLTDLANLLAEPEFAEAAGVLEMISKTPEDRLFYEARLKFLRDEESRLRGARQEGEERGLEKGVLFGEIRTYRTLLGKTQGTGDDLLNKSMAELAAIAADLKRQFSLRHNGS